MKSRRKQAHIAGQADQIHLRVMQRRDYVGIMLFAYAAFGWNQRRVQTAPLCRLKPWSVRAIGNYNRDFGVKFSSLDGIRDGFKI